MCTLPGIRMRCTNLISESIYEMNGWETSSILTPARRPSRDPFLPILSRETSEPGDSKDTHVASCFKN